MKQLPGGGGHAGWDRQMVQQLGFIRRHLRYPISRYTILPVAMLSLTMPAIAFLVYTSFAGRHRGEHYSWPHAMIICMIVLLALVGARRYWQTLHFIAVPTPYYTSDNQVLLLRFLQSGHFAFSRHPKAPEVFQIMSKTISALKDEREIVVFIADDKRILINSHFTQSGTSLAVGTSHHRQVADMLQAWLKSGGTGGEHLPPTQKLHA